MTTIATTVMKQSVKLFISAAVVHTALDVLEAAWRMVRKTDPTVES